MALFALDFPSSICFIASLLQLLVFRFGCFLRRPSLPRLLYSLFLQSLDLFFIAESGTLLDDPFQSPNHSLKAWSPVFSLF